MFASPLFWQIRYLVSNVTKKNLKSSLAELNQVSRNWLLPFSVACEITPIREWPCAGRNPAHTRKRAASRFVEVPAIMASAWSTVVSKSLRPWESGHGKMRTGAA